MSASHEARRARRRDRRAQAGSSGSCGSTLAYARAARGFTLIEVLVALAIVAIGMAAVLGAVGSSADTATYLREKTLAEWIALNQVATTRLQQQPPSKGSTEGELDYAGRHWRWHQDVTDGQLPGILQIDVSVQEADTPQGKDAPWIGYASSAIGDAVAQPQSTSLYLEYAQLPAPGTPNGGALQPNGGTVQPNGGAVPPYGSPFPPNGAANTPGAAPPSASPTGAQ